MKRNYIVPTQVKFFDGEEWKGGIAFQNYIICGCCGAIVEIPDLEEDEIVDFEWIDISIEIAGDEQLAD